MKNLLFTGISLAFLMSSCQPEESGSEAAKAARKLYFDVPGLVNSQVKRLNQALPEIEKKAQVGEEKPEIKKLKPANWSEELSYFKEIDLNKKALAGIYEVSETTNGNLTTTTYNLKPGNTAAVTWLQVKTNRAGKATELKAISEEKNALFYNREVRELKLNNLQKLQTYQIAGVQKVLLFDSLQYQISAKLL